MEFFHNPQVDWMGKTKYFVTVSVILLAVGIAWIIARGGLRYGVDFRGGTMVYVKFAQAPELGAIRHQLNAEKLHPTLQTYGRATEHEILVSLDLQTTAHFNALDQGRMDIVDALSKIYSKRSAGKADFDSASAETIAGRLLVDDPLHLASQGADVAQNTYQRMAQAMVKFRTAPAQAGVIEGFNQLSVVPGVNGEVISDLQKNFYLSGFSVFNTEVVGPKVGSTLRRQALYVVLAGLAAMLVYVWFRFELIFGVAAVIATFHDVIITLGIFTL
ncbi:MAG: protein translocase subunit SecF, partial [Terriglobia bacterium]